MKNSEKILVCGGAGYIGSHQVAELLDAGYEVVVFDSLEKGYREAVLPDARLYVGDLRNPDSLNKVFSQNKIDAVMHFAAYSLVGESVVMPDRYYDNNVCGTLCLLDAMRRHDVERIVFSSTAAVYGEPEKVPISESQKKDPTNPYGETKLAVEKMLKWQSGAYGLKYTALRYFNVAGAHKSGKMGEAHDPETHLIPVILKNARAGKKIQIFGNDYDTPDGTCIRDYIHVVDLCAAHILALEKLGRSNGDTYNLGYGHGFSNMQIVEAARKVTGVPIEVEMAARRPGDPSILIASPDKAVRELGFAPQYDCLETIIESAWNFRGY